MLKKVNARHLTLGMYVVELDRPWIETPFEMPFQLQGFMLESLEELEKVQKLCEHVYIDPRLGKDATYGKVDKRSPTRTDDTAQLPAVSASNRLEPVYHDSRAVEEELPTARQVLDDSRRIYEKVAEAVQKGRSANIAEIRLNMEAMVDSIVRNPDALTWLARLKHRDDYTYAHSIAVSVLSLALGRHLGLPREDLEVLGASTLLQDIGKLELPKKLLDKRGALSETEYKVIQKHVAFSTDILRKHKLLPRRALEIVVSHHERYDGSGYPRGIKGNRIDLLSTIAGLVDCYDAMVSPRPYSEPMTSFEALSRLYELANNAFPRAIVEHFIQCIGVFPIGSFVELSNGAIGVVVSRNRVRQLKPRIMLITDHQKNRLERAETIDLAEQEAVGGNPPLKISRAVEPEDYGIDPREFFA